MSKKKKKQPPKAAVKAAEEYDELCSEFADWVELKWDDYNNELKKAFIAGWVAKQKHDMKKLLPQAHSGPTLL